MNGLDGLVLARSAAQAGLAGRVTGIEMLAVQALEDLAVDGFAGTQAELGDCFAGPDAGRLAAFLGGRQVVADAPSQVLGSLAGLGSADLLPRVGGVVALGDGDDPGHRPPSSPR